MKNKKTQFGIFVLFLVSVLVLTGCPNGSTDPDSPEVIVIGGTLSPAEAVGSDVTTTPKTFYAEVSQNQRSVAGRNASRAVGDTVSFSISGKLRDGATMFNLTGEYAPEGKGFILSAASGYIVFQIYGRLDSNNAIDLSKTEANVLVRTSSSNGGEWKTVSCTVDIAGEPEKIDEIVNAPESDIAGFLSPYHGKWRNLADANEYVIVSEYAVTQYFLTGEVYSISIIDYGYVGGDKSLMDMIIGVQYFKYYNRADKYTTYYERHLVTDKWDYVPAAIKNYNLVGGYTVSDWINERAPSNALYVCIFSHSSGVSNEAGDRMLFNTVDDARSLDRNTDVVWVDDFSKVFVR
jgi:hypothetical protein